MAKIPQLSSSVPPAVTQLRGQLSLPTNFPTPVTSTAVSNAFSSLANTASNLGEFKQRLFDREQDTYSDSFSTKAQDELLGVLNNSYKKIDDSIRDPKNPHTSADGDSPVFDEIENWFNNESNYSDFEGYRSLTLRNKDRALNALKRTFRPRAREKDINLRTNSEQASSIRNYNQNRRTIAGTKLTFNLDEGGNPTNVSTEYGSALKKTFLHLITSGASQATFDTVSDDVVNQFISPENFPVFLKNPKLYLKYQEVLTDLLSDANGNPYSPNAVDTLRDYYTTVLSSSATANKDAKSARIAILDSATEEFEDTYKINSKTEAETFLDVNAIAAQYTRKNNLVDRYNDFKELADAGYGSNSEETFSDELKNTHRNNLVHQEAFSLIKPMLVDGMLPSDYLGFSGDRAEDHAIIEQFKNQTISQKLLLALEHYESKVEGISTEVGTKEDELKRDGLFLAVKKLTDYRNSYTGDKQAEHNFGKFRTLNGNVDPHQAMSIITNARSIGDFDPSSLELNENEILSFSDYDARLREDPLFRRKFTEKQVEDFRSMLGANVNNSGKAKVYYGVDLQLDEQTDDLGPFLKTQESMALSRVLLGSELGQANTGFTNALITKAHISLDNDKSYIATMDGLATAKDAAKEGFRRKGQEILLKKVAQLINRNYIKVGNKRLFLSFKEFPSQNSGAGNHSTSIEIGRVLASNMAFGPEVSKVLEEIRGNESFFDVSGSYPYENFVDSPTISPDRAVELLEASDKLDNQGTHRMVYKSLIDTIKGSASNLSVTPNVNQWLSAVRDGTTIKSSSDGKMYYEFMYHEQGMPITTRNLNSSELRVLLGEEGQRAVMLQDMKWPSQLLRGELGFDKDEIDDLSTGTMTFRDASVDYPTRSKELLDSDYSFNDNAPITTTSKNGLVRRFSYGDGFTGYRIEEPVAPKIDSALKNRDRTYPNMQQYQGTQRAHIFSRFYSASIDMPSNTLDEKVNLEPSSIQWNQQIQLIPERKKHKEIEKWINDNPTEGLIARWDIVTYSPEFPLIEKGPGSGMVEVKKEPMMSHMEWRFRVVKPNTEATKLGFKQETVVKEWPITITDERVLSLMSRNNLFLKQKK